MSHRIAPPGEVPAHMLCWSWMNQFAGEIEKLNAGEGDGGVLFALCGEWAQYRGELLRCGGPSVSTWPPRIKAHIMPHAHIVQFVDVLKLDVEALYGWPPPAEMHIDEARALALRDYARELNECRERVDRMY